jgi:hypothetical protein
MRSRELTASVLGSGIGVCAALLAACSDSDEQERTNDRGDSKPVSQVPRLAVETAPGVLPSARRRRAEAPSEARSYSLSRLCSFESPVGLSGPAGPVATERSP